MLTLNDGRSELWQWDTGRKLTVDADCSQVHFSNKLMGRSIDVDVVDGVAIIPDALLQTDKDLTAWAFAGTPENGYTKISKVFKVNKRNKPSDYVFTPPEQTALQELDERLVAIEESQDPDAIKNAVEDYLEQNPVEAPVQSVNGKTGGVKLTAEDVGAISHDELQEATNEALAQAKASGEFDGLDGKSAYQIAVDNGFRGSESEWLESLKGGGGGGTSVSNAVLYTEQELTEEQQAQARKNIGADSTWVSVLDADPAEPKEGQMWILKTVTEELTTPVIELGTVGEDSIAIKLSNASFDGSGAVVSTYNIYVNGALTKTVSIAAGGTCVVTGLSPETEYQISVRSVKGAVISAASNTLIATTKEADEPVEPKIVYLPGIVIGYANGDVSIGSNSVRAVAVYTVGDKACVNKMESSDIYYPIPVPADATSCTVVCPGLMFGYNGWNLSAENKYSYDVDSGWKTSGTTYTFEAGAAAYVNIGFKRTDNGEVTLEDVTGITITFA